MPGTPKVAASRAVGVVVSAAACLALVAAQSLNVTYNGAVYGAERVLPCSDAGGGPGTAGLQSKRDGARSTFAPLFMLHAHDKNPHPLSCRPPRNPRRVVQGECLRKLVALQPVEQLLVGQPHRRRSECGWGPRACASRTCAAMMAAMLTAASSSQTAACGHLSRPS